ncbi:hypothetical protein C0J52_14646 [Blattella germanica]|nr:hypothetical protein C0J52_14646 [Blattella germanica]
MALRLSSRRKTSYKSRFQRALCAGGCNVNVRTARGETALHIAVASRKTSDNPHELVTTLLEAGCDANIQDNLQGRTALHALVRALVDQASNSCPLVLETFQQVAKRSDVNLKDHRQRTPLHRLAASGYTRLEAFQLVHPSLFLVSSRVQIYSRQNIDLRYLNGNPFLEGIILHVKLNSFGNVLDSMCSTM